MSILGTFWNELRATWLGPITTSHPEVAKYLFDYAPTSTGISVNERTALNYSAVWGAVQAIAPQAASLPCILYTQSGRDKERDTGSPLYDVLRWRPNPETNAMVFEETLIAHMLLWGNAYAEIEFNNAGEPIALWQLTPDKVTPFRNKSGQLLYRVGGNPEGADVILSPEQVLHIPGLGFDGVTGYSVISKARESIGLGLAMEKFSASFFGNGSTFGGILTHQNSLTPEQVNNLSEQIEKRHQGLSKAHRFLILQNGADYKQLGIPQRDAQFLESRQFSVIEICRWFNVSPAKLHDLTHGTFSNVEQQNQAHLTDTMRPILIRFEQEYKAKLCKADQYVEHLVDGYHRADIGTRYNAYAIAIQNGIMTQNEVRQREGLNPLPGGDELLKPLNMRDASQPQDTGNEQ